MTDIAVNQAPPRVDVDEYELNHALRDGVKLYGVESAEEQLHRVGRHVGTAEFQRDAELANVYSPKLHQYDRYGARIDELEYDESYHRIMRAHLAEGGHSSAWEQPGPGAEVARAAVFMLFAQVEAGHACPVSMTHSAVPVIRQNDEVAKLWVARALSRDYDPVLRGGAGTPGGAAQPDGGKHSAILGMAMTEKQGGSDVRANLTLAQPDLDNHVLYGHKWFCSAPGSDAFLVLAQAPGGLSCFFVPRVLDDGTRNPFTIARLKDKLGNRSNASGEIEFDGTIGFLINEEGRGVRTILDMVSLTRLDTVLGTVAGMRQSTAEAVWHIRNRKAFGALLIHQPAMAAVVADLALETEAATALGMRLARAYDSDASDQEKAFRRLATAVAKYWVCKRGPGHAYEALECLGGNGYAENFPLARRYREQPVMAIWEGSGNVIALDVLRALSREPDSVAAVDAELGLALGSHADYDAHVARVRTTAQRLAGLDPEDAALEARGFAADLALALEASLLIRHAPAAVADLFVASRLSENARHGHLYGALPTGDLAAVLARS